MGSNSRSLSGLIFWLLIALVQLWIVVNYVELLGGIDRIFMINRGPSLAAQIFLLVGACLFPWLSWERSKDIFILGRIMSVVAFLLGFSFFFPGIPVLGFFNPYMSPFGIVGVVMPFFIGFISMISGFSDSPDKDS